MRNLAAAGISQRRFSDWFKKPRVRARIRDSLRAARRWDRLSVSLPPEAEGILKSMYASQPQLGTDGQTHPIDARTRIPRDEGLFLKQTHQAIRPALSVEIGLAYGFSTVYLLSAMKEGNYGQHIAIDPFQTTSWHGIGVQKAADLGMDDRFLLMERESASALPQLAEERRKAQFIFVDGSHRFDDVLLDFCLADRICDLGGWMIFDDLWMPSIQKVLAFIESNRREYEPRPCPVRNAAAFEKVGEDRRDWRHFVAF